MCIRDREEAGTLPMNPETPVPEEYKEAEPLVAKLIEMGNDVESVSYTHLSGCLIKTGSV